MDLNLAPLAHGHLDQVLAIEQACFLNPWSRGMFSQELMSPLAMDRVALDQADGRVVGFIILWMVVGEVQVQNIAVDPGLQRRGVGRWLLLKGLAQARELGARACTLEARAGNQAALALYQSLGFERQGVRPRYYWPEKEDAILMGRRL
ncbi:MAG: ribosomal protein S18-alanine N-acetyltransferase [Desulfarculaceae bacterium]|nr:ribosomal protein S18-alanine N-acetyltransferase [Desulfarculaceae bacterium]MCF8072316.1 ribosomal protein S18-alanine N-acetyltransferase [Desulfarculaceae bacterium]MCF8100237.1 ribosomal protein S18-alanine N-acetyltransferase [Desulfarculaceae bacterium]MCF8116190.1 ribosomal protein S18-alanine N-acetyltransferase [Desulfarculaceae bacterium]